MMVEVEKVFKNGASKGILRKGDIITDIVYAGSWEKVRKSSDIRRIMKKADHGKRYVRILRDGKKKEVYITMPHSRRFDIKTADVPEPTFRKKSGSGLRRVDHRDRRAGVLKTEKKTQITPKKHTKVSRRKSKERMLKETAEKLSVSTPLNDLERELQDLTSLKADMALTEAVMDVKKQKQKIIANMNKKWKYKPKHKWLKRLIGLIVIAASASAVILLL
jgi:hypothetical protein